MAHKQIDLGQLSVESRVLLFELDGELGYGLCLMSVLGRR